MKSFLRFIGWVVGVPVGILLLIAILGYSAARWNFWPPSCEVLPIPQAKRVCEFSKLEKVSFGKPAKLSVWVTVPNNTPNSDLIILAIDGKDSIAMKKVGPLSYEVVLDIKTGDNISYKFLRNSEKSFSESRNFKMRSLEKTIYDYVNNWSDLPPSDKLSQSLMPGLQTMDTWSINYNFNFFENTRWNLEETMARAAAMGAKEFGVFSFIEMFGNKDDFTLQDYASQYKYMRDASISAKDMKNIAKSGRAFGLKTVIHYNVGADYAQFYRVDPISALTAIGRGEGGNSAEVRAGKLFGREDPKTKEWLDREFSQLQGVLVKWAGWAEDAGIDAIDITPQYRMPNSGPYYDYADAKYSEIIKEIRKVFSGKVYASNFNNYGGLRQEPKPKYINDVDGLYLYLPLPNVSRSVGLNEIRFAYTDILNRIESNFSDYKRPIFLAAGIGSYDGILSGVPSTEWNDFAEVDAAGYKQDWQEQANAYEGLMQALADRSKFSAIITNGYWYDDLMAPKYMDPRNNLMGTIRNKPAEAVWKKWILSK